MRRFHKLLAGASWMGEYGDPDTDDWSFLQRYSPYHNLDEATAYPPILVTTSTRDDRVHPGHARKLVSKLLDLGKGPFGFSLVGVQGKDIVDGNRKLTLAIIWQLFRYHLVSFLTDLRKKAGGGTDTELKDEDMVRRRARRHAALLRAGLCFARNAARSREFCRFEHFFNMVASSQLYSRSPFHTHPALIAPGWIPDYLDDPGPSQAGGSRQRTSLAAGEWRRRRVARIAGKPRLQLRRPRYRSS